MPILSSCLLLLLLLITITFLYDFSLPTPPPTLHRHRPIQPPDLSQCHLISLSPSSPPLNCCSPIIPPDFILDFTFPTRTSPLRIRPAAHLVDSHYIAKYAKAVQLMKDLPDTDPRSFVQQANLHCAYCNGAYDQLGFPNVQLLIHNSWLFFPWHRFYLYFHERILGKLIGDDSFALPFWNWDAPEGMMMPSMYVNPNTSSSLYHPNRDPSHLPPVMVDLNYIERQNASAAELYTVDDNLRIMYRQMMENGATTELFLGSAFRAGEQPELGAGSLEFVPHDTVHLWTGDPRKKHKEDMGAFYSAARDPIFPAHHANIDRLWWVWKSLGGKHKDFIDEDWLDATFLFYDEEARPVKVRVRDCVDMERLRYRYQEVQNPWINVSRRHTMKNIFRDNHYDNYNYPVELNKFPVRVEREAVVVKVKRPPPIRSGEEVEVLLVEGIESERTESTRFDVYVNALPVDLTIPALTRECAGTFVSMPQLLRQERNVNEGRRTTNLKLGIKELLEEVGAAGDDSVVVTLVPRMGKATVAGVSIVLS